MARVPAFQADCCGFESHHPLHWEFRILSLGKHNSTSRAAILGSKFYKGV